MREIGQAVGVSAVTVSKALAGKPGMSEAVRDRIRQTAENMGYAYPGSARGEPVRGLDIGILVPEAFFHANSFYAALYKRIIQELTAEGHFGVLELLTREAEEGLRMPKIVETQRVQGLILMGQPSKAYYRMMAECGTPVMFLDFYDESGSADAVVGDNGYGCYRLTSHLLKNGHRKIAFVGSWQVTSSIMDRYLGYYRALLTHDLPLRPEWVLPDRDAENHLMAEIPLPEELPTAFVCNCDVVARRLIRQLKKRGIRVPEDISVTGFDDYEVDPGEKPGISTFHLDLDAMSEMTVRVIVDRCAENRKAYGRTVIGGKPIYRESERAMETGNAK